MRTLLFLLLLPCLAQAQLRASYPGDFRAGRLASGNVSLTAPLPATLAWYGDSITQGSCNATSPPAKLLQMLPGYSGVNRGVSGETMAQIAARYFAGMATDCGGEVCGTYVVAGGTNDCGTGECDTDVVLATHLSVVDDALSKGRRVVSFNIPPSRCAPEIESCVGGNEAGALKALEYRTKWQAACAARPAVACLDAFEEMEATWTDAEERGYLVDAYTCSPADRVHTSQAGADYLAAMARRAFP